ncbi:MAG: glycosyltransferase family 2 protein [Ignavibacteriaceae bacterium]|nr:glycosyltransferase family 2 protein [Ignavibacteriaceae bacterium]
MNQPRVIIILLNYNRPIDTLECINSLKKLTYQNFMIILIDNKSTDNSDSIFNKEFSFKKEEPCQDSPEIIYFSTEKNLGYTGGTNYGIQKAMEINPEYILILNNDTITEPDFLDCMVNEMQNHKKAVASCGLILAEHDRKTIWYAGGTLNHLRGLAVHSLKGQSRDLITDVNSRYVDFITGCMILFRSEALKVIGLEDERYFMYLDDIELSSRAKTMGLSLLFIPKAVIYHKILGETESPFKLYYSVRNRLLLISQMNKGLLRIISTAYFITVIALKLIYWKLFNKNFYKAARIGIRDYYNKNFYKGNGMEFISYYET